MHTDRQHRGQNTGTRSAAPGLTRVLGSPMVTSAVLLVLVGLVLGALGGASEADGSGWITMLLLAGVAAGCAALAWVRPQRSGVSPPHVMLSLGFVGMLLGLLFDVQQSGIHQLGALCAQAGSLGMLEALRLHLSFLPGMHAGMLAGGLLAIPLLRRLRPHCNRYLCSLFTQNLLCSAWMVVGMTFGGLWLSRWPAPLVASTLPGMLGGMFVGMTWGMVASVMLYRSFFMWRNRTHRGAGKPAT